MFLSIIIPVYNAVKTIDRCLDSIWSQGLPEDDYEVICVDDCSTDNSIELLTVESNIHSQLRIIRNTTNLRAGGARNQGVISARGEYILFIDADDYFHPQSLKKAYQYQKDNRLDILMCDFARHKEDNPNNEIVHKFPNETTMTGREFLVSNSLPYAPWKYIFKRSLMIDNNVFFAEKVSCEDVDWSHKIAFYADRMQYQPILLTHYILMDTSQTSVEYKNSATVFHRLQAGHRLTDLLSLCKTDEERRQIKAVAQSTLKNGVVFLNALIDSPSLKASQINKSISKHEDWGTFLNFVRDNSLLYSVLSTLISPLFKSAIYIKRKYLGR